MIQSGTPVFSIITPTFKRPHLLKRNILSVKAQTFDSYEHIIVDDANDLETLNLVSLLDDPKIRLIKNTRQHGAAGAYNAGIIESRSNFLLFLDDDDEYLPCFLEKVKECFQNSGSKFGFLWTGISRIKDTNSGELILSDILWPSFFSTKEDGFVAATSIGNGYGVCVRRECIDEIGMYDENLKVAEDTDFLFRLAFKFDFRTIPEALVKIHQHDITQLTRDDNFEERISGKEIIISRYQDLLNQFPKLHAVHYKAYADLCYRSGLKESGRRAVISIMKKRPQDFRSYSDFISYELSGKSAGNTILGKAIKRTMSFFKVK